MCDGYDINVCRRCYYGIIKLKNLISYVCNANCTRRPLDGIVYSVHYTVYTIPSSGHYTLHGDTAYCIVYGVISVDYIKYLNFSTLSCFIILIVIAI